MPLKLSPSRLFDGYRFREPGSVLITGENGSVEAITDAASAGDDVQFVNGTLTPGFVNSHCHLELSHMAGIIPRHTGLPGFLLNVMQQRAFAPPAIQEAMLKADAAMQREGIVAVGDICNTTQSLSVKKSSSILYYNLIETMGVVAEKAAARFEQSQKVWEAFSSGNAGNFIGASIVPHAPYSVSPALFDLIAAFDANKVVSIHMQESAAEKEFLSKGTGAFREFFDKAGLPAYDMLKEIEENGDYCNLHVMKTFQSTNNILVHNVETDNTDIDFALHNFDASSLFWCLCPQANLYISQKLPDIGLLNQRGLQLVLGTDSLASNAQLSIVSEINCIRSHFPGLPLEEILQWATINGAKALQIDDRIGSFEPGKTPGVVLIADSWEESTRLL